MATTASGSRMPRSSVNFSRGRILPRATPVRSGTRHSISVTRCWLSHCSSSAKVYCSFEVMKHLCAVVAPAAAPGQEAGQAQQGLRQDVGLQPGKGPRTRSR
jgi:hypothetical protein